VTFAQLNLFLWNF